MGATLTLALGTDRRRTDGKLKRFVFFVLHTFFRGPAADGELKRFVFFVLHTFFRGPAADGRTDGQTTETVRFFYSSHVFRGPVFLYQKLSLLCFVLVLKLDIQMVLGN